MQQSYDSRDFFPSDSNPVDLLSAGRRAEFAAADKQCAGLGHEHPAVLAPDHLSRPAVAGCYARASWARRRKKPPDKANRDVGQNTIEYKSEKHYVAT